ncbi:flagellin N-terminal helical domain-containing protein [Fluviispira vulneris]|uniref:flagellin N-terminal helical domain-containing protein n=1 Tax=Fluviispira vulneris TaxID=2763012 RepID=UPI001645A420|nr:flagellin [Fluviispira vulneris]
MGMRIQTNISSINAQRNLSVSTLALAKHTERISSGYRINHAADDAAGLAISEKLKSNIRGMAQAKRNTSDGISLIQTAEGGLHEISNMLIRLKELSIQAASDTIGDNERGHIQKEFVALKDEIDRIALATEFNGTRLLTGKAEIPEDLLKNSNRPPLEIQVGPSWYQAVDGLDEVRNPVHIIRINLEKINAMTGGEGSLGLGNVSDEEGTRLDKKIYAQQTINKIDEAIDKVNEYRAILGAIQNRMGYAVANTATMIENQEAAKSRIKDADYADESSQVVQQGILQKAGVAVLSQANQIPEMALKLLG